MPVVKSPEAATLGAVAKYFGGSLAQFRKEWEALTEDDKQQLKNGIGDGTYTY